MTPITKCSVCKYRKESKESLPCSTCSDNIRYCSHFKEDEIVDILKNAWGITGNIFASKDEQSKEIA